MPRCSDGGLGAGDIGDVAGLFGLGGIGYLPSLTPRSILIATGERKALADSG